MINKKSNPNWYMTKELNIRIKTNISTKLITYLKARRFYLNLMWNGNAFQTLGPCMRRLLVPKET